MKLERLASCMTTCNGIENKTSKSLFLMQQGAITDSCCFHYFLFLLTLLHSERPKLYTILAFLSAIGLRCIVKLQVKQQFSFFFLTMGINT